MLASGRSLGFNAGWPGGFTQGSERGLQLSFGCQVISRLLSLRDSLLRHKENPGRFFIVTLAHYRSHHDGNFSSFGLNSPGPLYVLGGVQFSLLQFPPFSRVYRPKSGKLCACHPPRSCGHRGGLSFVSLVPPPSHKGFQNRSLS